MTQHNPGRSFVSLQLQPKNLFLPATLAAVFLLRWKLAMPWWGLALILMALPLYYFVLPRLVRRQERIFEREILRLLQEGRKSELLALYRRQTLLRFFGSSDKLQKRLGFIYSEIGDFDRARACYARAARSAGPGERLQVLLGLAQARYRAGDYEGAEVVYRELIRRGQEMPEVLGGLAHTLLLRGRDRGEAFRLAKKAVGLTPDSALGTSLHITLAEAFLARGKPGKARKELEKAAVGPDDESWLKARRSWAAALLALHDGDEDEAWELLDEAARLDEGGGLGELAEQRLAELDDEPEEDEKLQQAG